MHIYVCTPQTPNPENEHCNILPEVMDEPEEPTAAGDVNFQASRNLENVQNTPQTSNPENEHCNIFKEH
jgi:hypothetical protein